MVPTTWGRVPGRHYEASHEELCRLAVASAYTELGDVDRISDLASRLVCPESRYGEFFD